MNRRIAPAARWVGALVPAVLLLLAGAAPAASAAVPAANAASGPRPLLIQTIPAIPGARFALDGQLLVTGRDGTVRTFTTKTQRDELALSRDAHLTVGEPVILLRAGVRAVFSAWYDGGYHYSNTNRTGQVLRASFNLDYLTTFSFVRPNGTAVVPHSLSGVVLHTTTGATIAVAQAKPIWLRGVEVQSTSGHLAVNDVAYKVGAVEVDGDNVVHEDQQRFVPSHQPHVVVRLLLFTVTFKAKDALFGFDSGSAVDLKFADGTVRHALLHKGSVTLTDLPRGDYALTLHASGIVSDKTLSVSRDQTANLQVMSWLDIGFGLVIVLLLLGALFMAARSRRYGRLASRTAPVVAAPVGDKRVLERSAPAR